MNKLLLGSLAIGAGLAVSRLAFKARSARPAGGASRASYEAVETFIQGEMRRLRIPGVSLAIVEGDQIVLCRGFGRARPGGEGPTRQTPFFIGSLTKSVTALAVMQLVEAGKVELDASVQRYLPWFRVADPIASAEVTVRHLLNQTSGLPESAGELDEFDESHDAGERQARALASLRLIHPPGSVVEYCNMNYVLLGLILEAASGKSYEGYVQQHILNPLGMRHTYTSRAAARESGLAMGHRYWFGFPVPQPDLPFPRGGIAAGQLIATAGDMAHWLIAHMNEGRYGQAQILSAAGIEELQRGAIEYRKMGISAGKYAMGWLDSKIGETRVVWHTGTVPDFEGYMAILPEQKTGVVVLFNACHWWFNPVYIDLGMQVAALLAGEQYKPTGFSALVPLILRAQLLIPAFQAADVVATTWLLGAWQRDARRRVSAKDRWAFAALLPLVLNLLIGLTVTSVLGKRRDYLKLYMPDYFWLATICGSLALPWSIARTVLVLRALKGPPSR